MSVPQKVAIGSICRPKLTTQQIGRLGEMLVQYELLRHGIESAPFTTDAGVDLVAYSGIRGRSYTVQVKTNLAPKASGGKGAPALDWWVNEDCPAGIDALVDISNRRVWLFTKDQLATASQQHSRGRFHLYMYVPPDRTTIAYETTETSDSRCSFSRTAFLQSSCDPSYRAMLADLNEVAFGHGCGARDSLGQC